MIDRHNKPLLLMAVTVPETLSFFNDQINYLVKSGFDVSVICSPGWENRTQAKYYPIKIEREISILQDLRSLFHIIKLLILLKPDIICAGTPKASFLVELAAFITRVPVRVYLCLGIRLETTQGFKRKILYLTEKITAACATRVWCISQSVKDRLQTLQLVNPCKLDITGYGGVGGVDLSKFRPSRTLEDRKALLDRHLIPLNAHVIGYVGRLVKDKGIVEAIEAFEELKNHFNEVFLVLVGSFEDRNPLPPDTLKTIHNDPQVILTGFVNNVNSYYRLFNLLWLPSYREGMGNVLLEAGASGIPVIACNTTGCVDVVDHGKNGYLIQVGSVPELVKYTQRILLDNELASKLGNAGRIRVEKRFSQEIICENMSRYLSGLIENCGTSFKQRLTNKSKNKTMVT